MLFGVGEHVSMVAKHISSEDLSVPGGTQVVLKNKEYKR